MLIQWQTGRLTIIMRWKQKNRQTGKDRVRMRHKEEDRRTIMKCYRTREERATQGKGEARKRIKYNRYISLLFLLSYFRFSLFLPFLRFLLSTFLQFPGSSFILTRKYKTLESFSGGPKNARRSSTFYWQTGKSLSFASVRCLDIFLSLTNKRYWKCDPLKKILNEKKASHFAASYFSSFFRKRKRNSCVNFY